MFRLISLVVLALLIAACGTNPSAPGDAGNGSDGAPATDAAAGPPVEHADLIRLCALETACLGTLRRLGIEGAVGGCASPVAARLARAFVDARVEVTPLVPGPGMMTAYYESRGDPAFLRANLERARTAATCADYLGPYYARWARCQGEGRYCDGDTRVDCSTGDRLVSATDCSMLGGCSGEGLGASCRMPTMGCSLEPREYVRCDGANIRVGCGETLACPAGTRCVSTASETMRGTTRVTEIRASCGPSASAIPVRCADGSMVGLPGNQCPPGPAPPPACATGTLCEGNRIALCLDGRRAELDCAALTGGACRGSRCEPR